MIYTHTLFDDGEKKVEILDFVHNHFEEYKNVKPRSFTDYTRRDFEVWKYLALKALYDEKLFVKGDDILISRNVIYLEEGRIYTFIDDFKEFEPVVELLQMALADSDNTQDLLDDIDEQNIKAIKYRDCDKIDFALISTEEKDNKKKFKILFFKIACQELSEPLGS